VLFLRISLRFKVTEVQKIWSAQYFIDCWYILFVYVDIQIQSTPIWYIPRYTTYGHAISLRVVPNSIKGQHLARKLCTGYQDIKDINRILEV